MDYNLAALSPRAFEHLSQALALKYLGIGGIVFGDGPDGGREATFAGRTNYDIGDGPWDGYTVLQAKFLQKPQDTAADGAWLLKQLRAELRDFTKKGSRRRLPEYYLLVTNVTLSSVQDTGTKDKAFDILRRSKVGARGVDVWDYDKLRALLDQSPELTQRYAAWITPGDVLSAVIRALELSTPNFERTLSRYLQNEMFADQYANLEQAGHSPDERVPMAQVFVDLPVAGSSPADQADDRPFFLRRLLDGAADRLSPSCVEPSADTAKTGFAPQLPLGRLVLVGGPGQGKTTLGQFVCQLFRSAILLSRPPATVDRDALTTARQVQAWCERDGYSLPSVRRFPVRIALSELAVALAEETHVGSILDFVADRISNTVSTALSPDLFRAWLAEYPWLVVLDGLDEVPASSNRDEVISAVRGFMIEVADADADVLLLATTRPQGYSDDFNPRIYDHQTLVPLTPPEALLYADRLAEVRFGENAARRGRVMERLRAAVNNETTARLMTSPLQVTLMTILVDRRGHPPQERWSLFYAYYDAIYSRELERDVPTAAVLRAQRPNVDAIHRQVGLVLQAESERTKGTEARLTVDRFRAIVRDRLSEEGFEGGNLAVVEGQIVEAAANRLVFLVGLEADRVGFEIRSLQEFWAAECLMESGDDLVRRRLTAIAPSPSWRNVFLFAAGKCFADRQHLRDSIYAICAELNESEDATLVAVLAGSRLALDVLDEGSVRQQPKYDQLFVRLSLRVLDLPPESAQDRLAAMYHTGVDRAFREDIERSMRSKEFHQRLPAWKCLIGLASQDVEWALETCTTEWPESEKESLRLLSLVNRSAPLGAFAELFASVLLRLPTWQTFHYWYDFTRTRHAPAWLRWVGHAQAQRRTEIPAPLGHNGTLALFLGSVEGRMPSPPPDLSPLETGHASWQVLARLGDFMREPSEAAAAALLRAFAPIVGEQLPTPHRTAYPRRPARLGPFGDWPWPVSALLFSSPDQTELLARADGLEAGVYGTLDDWRAAESDWLSSPADFIGVATSFDVDVPINRDNERIELPFASLYRVGHLTPLVIDDALVARVESCPPSVRGLVARMLVDAVVFGVMLHGERPPQWYLNAWCALYDLADPEPHINLEFLDGLLGHDADEHVECIDKMARSLAISPYQVKRRRAKLGEIAERAIRADPGRLGMIKLLALTGEGVAVDPTVLPEPSDDMDPTIQLALFLLSLRPQAVDAISYVDQLARAIGRASWQVETVVEASLKRGASVDWCERLLDSFLSRIPADHYQSRAQAIAALVELLSRRLSPLSEPEVWTSLNLGSPT